MVLLAGCQRETAAPAEATVPRIATMVPAATDILLAIGAGDRIVAVSNYEPASAKTDGLPRVGDYTNVDMERLTAVRPTHLVVFVTPEKLPAGLAAKAAAMGTSVLNVRTDTLAEIEQAIEKLAGIAGLDDSAARKFQQGLDGLAKLDRPVRVLLALGDDGLVIGPGGFLDELLVRMGAINAAGALGGTYPTVDEERLADLQPEVVIVLSPNAGPEKADAIRQTWMRRNKLPAVQTGRVVVLTSPRLLISGYCVVETGREIGRAIEGLR
jgi:ABC-type Fe3+-hydroxamate transport system substrate-binding protein